MSVPRLAIADIAKHQHPADFVRMQQAGVQGVILRVCHGDVVDSRFAELYPKARQVFGGDVGFYVFYNPHRATAAVSAGVFVDTVRRVVGRTDVALMLDVEAYGKEKPAGPELPPSGNAAYVRQLSAEIGRLAPNGRVFAYSNAAYWDKAVGDDDLASSMDWIVPRYPVYPPSKVTDPAKGGSAAKLQAWMTTSPKPGSPDTWELFAFGHAPDGPRAPRGVGEWAGWQFSAGYNCQGPVYGVSSRDIDLSIVDAAAWQRWTGGGSGARVPKRAGPAVPMVNTLHSGEQLLPGHVRVNDVGSAVLAHQLDGNVVLSVDGHPVWDTRTAGKATTTFVMQGDGNLVLYAADGRPLWNSITMGHPGAQLFVRGSVLELHDPAGLLLWSSTNPQPVKTASALVVRPDGRRTVVVLPGEGWFQVAVRAGIGGANWPRLAKANGGTTRVLHPGDVLVLP